MRVITKVEFMDVPYDHYTIYRLHEPYRATEVITHDGKDYVDNNVIIEHIHGKRFCHSRGLDFVLGIDKKSQEILNLCYDVFDQQEVTLHTLRDREYRLNFQLNKIKTASFWQRLKWLFLGVVSVPSKDAQT